MSLVTGKDILNVLFELKNPANLNEIVDRLHASNEGSKTALLKETEVILNAGVRFGFIMEEDNQYRAEYMFPPDQRIQPRDVDEKNKKPSKQFYPKTAVSSDEDDLNEHEDDCGPRLSRRRRSRSRSIKRRVSRRRRRHG